MHLVLHMLEFIFLIRPCLFLQDLTYLKHRRYHRSSRPSPESASVAPERWRRLNSSPSVQVSRCLQSFPNKPQTLPPPSPLDFLTDLSVLHRELFYMHRANTLQTASVYMRRVVLSGFFVVFFLGVGKQSCSMNNYETKQRRETEAHPDSLTGKEDEWKHALFTPTAAVTEMKVRGVWGEENKEDTCHFFG